MTAANSGVPDAVASRKLVVVALGANLDDPVHQVRQACLRLAREFPGGFAASSLWTSSPVDCPPGSPQFVNAVVVFDAPAGATPETLLRRFQQWEQEAGRPEVRGLNAPRPLDLDLIAFGTIRLSSDRLTLPHPRAHQRRFVLVPLAEVTPHLRLPGWKDDVATTLAGLTSDEVLKRLGPALPA